MPKLFVQNFPWSTTEHDLKEHFNDAGFEAVAAQVCIDATTKKSKGFGFVQLADESQNDEAIATMHAQDFKGRPLTVKPANPPTSRH